MKNRALLTACLLTSAALASCGGDDAPVAADVHDAPTPEADAHASDGHEHAEDPLGTVSIGGMEVELLQGHGPVGAGHEGHLVVKLPYSDSGSTVVRAWIGAADRTLSYVGKGTYAAGHDDYDVHATAPTPLPENAMWWIEIEKPDGTLALGSARPILE